jgi:ribosomal protein S18 acetylase RimI-like enzyme
MHLEAGANRLPTKESRPTIVQCLSPINQQTSLYSVLWLTCNTQFEYRFTKCGGLCLGLFTSVDTSDPSAPLASVETASSAHHVYSGAPARKSVLLAHCVVTKTTNSTVMDEDMEVPSDWKTSGASTGKIGHQEEGRTVAVHSLAVLPSLQNRGLGSTLLKAFVQRLGYVQAADRVVLLAHGELVKFYEKLGFENKGPSKATFGGGNWVDMASYTMNLSFFRILTKRIGTGGEEHSIVMV